VIDSLQRISKPSLRVYVKSTEMPSVMNGLGIVIVSTPKGVMTGQNAAAENVGGEVLCSIS
jgi:small subunit ribosomal protein S8